MIRIGTRRTKFLFARLKTSVYGGTYGLDLFSDFTLFLEDPVNGDQFEPLDDRWFAGGECRREFAPVTVLGKDAGLVAGGQTHHDWIDGIAWRFV